MRPRLAEEGRASFNLYAFQCLNRALFLLKIPNRGRAREEEMLNCAHVLHAHARMTNSKDDLSNALWVLTNAYLDLRVLPLARSFALQAMVLAQASLEDGKWPLMLEDLVRVELAEGNRQEAQRLVLNALKENSTDTSETGLGIRELLNDLWERLRDGKVKIDDHSKVDPSIALADVPSVYFAKDPSLFQAGALDHAVEVTGRIRDRQSEPDPDDREHAIYTIHYSFDFLGGTHHQQVRFSINTYHLQLGMGFHDFEDFEEGLAPGQPVHLEVLSQPPFLHMLRFGNLVDEVMKHEAVWS